MLATNCPLLLIGMKYLGKGFGVRTTISIFLICIFVDLLREVLHLHPVSHDSLLVTLFGGLFIGIGVELFHSGLQNLKTANSNVLG